MAEPKSYRVPEGWSDEAARLVWETWQRARDGGEAPTRRVPNMSTSGRRSLDRFLREAGEAQDPFTLEGTGGRWFYRGRAEATIGWDSPDDQLRAWAAVGAPVLAFAPPDPGATGIDTLQARVAAVVDIADAFDRLNEHERREVLASFLHQSRLSESELAASQHPWVCGVCAQSARLVWREHEARPGVTCGGSGMTPEDSYDNAKVRERSEARCAHPLTEWIATALSSRLSPHSSVIGVPGDIGLIRLCLYHCAVDIREDLTAPEVYCAEVFPYLGEQQVCRTPAELREALDRLGSEVRDV